MKDLVSYFKEYKEGKLSEEDLVTVLSQYQTLHNNSRLLCAMGTSLKSSKDFQRLFKSIMGALTIDLAAIELGPESLLKSEVTENTKKEAKLLAKEIAIRPLWLQKDLEE